MGRRVTEIPIETMRRVELAEVVYPFPFLRYAWLGILLQLPKSDGQNIDIHSQTHTIWFLKLPLDEQGLLQQAARDDFLHRLLDTLTNAPGNDLTEASLDSNPLGFKPREDKMAVFHARVARQLGEPPSQYYAFAREYFSGQTGFDQWNFIGLQGLADIAARLEDDNNAAMLAKAIPDLPATPFAALCGCLENFSVDISLSAAMIKRMNQALVDTDPVLTAACLRGLSNCRDQNTRRESIKAALNNRVATDVEVLATIAGRCWQALDTSELRLLFLEALALCEAGPQAFAKILVDLLFLPGLGQAIREDFNSTQKSTYLAKAISTFLASIQ